MLDRTNTEHLCADTDDFDWLGLTQIERRLIRLYRRLSVEEQIHLRRVSEVLAVHPEELEHC
ncbi:hypothetical protein HKK52_11085 [Pseudomonas sp. ADAK2]|uniref:hypothetical protein n=1 Tax=unclassified Pseudomonas TaxID=196821 RepID=UPI0014632369|nr:MULTISPECIES: hypothetical protein [unclassified Pseudomonas]QJI41437.1 hypothetical protein HKK53_11085 [Pseudomonas sp. ADAK7]QJI47741.1 hypothetical protein HKK52_11085 [Pseudomonas sp. ADAK2]